MNKDWMDFFREQGLSEEMAPSPDGWSQIGRKMRRATAIRRSTLGAALLLPAAALLIWSPWHISSIPVEENAPVAINNVPSVEHAPVSQEEIPIVPNAITVNTKRDPVNRSSAPAISREAPVVPGETTDPAVTQDVPPDLQDESTEAPVAAQINTFPALSEPSLQHHHLSFGVKVGSGTVRRNTTIKLQSTPYIAALMYLNSHPAVVPAVRSNTSNTMPFEALANEYLYPSSTSNYRHDLPVSLGITARLDLTSRMGLESGLEYTYLHSTAESTGGRLDQQLHFIGIPLRLDARLISYGGFDLYAGVGAKTEKCVAASLGVVRCEEKRFQWSAEAFAGIQYGLWNHTHLYFQPEISYYLTQTDLVTIRTEKPFTLTLHAGLRFDLTSLHKAPEWTD